MTAAAGEPDAAAPRNPLAGLAVGTVVLGGSNYVFLALVGNVVGGVVSAPVSVLWTMMAGLAVGLFQPVEQLLSRGIARRRAEGLSVRPTLVRVAMLAAGLLVASLAVLVAAAGPVSSLLFSGRSEFTVLLAVGLASSTVLFFVRGWLAGEGRFGTYALEMALEGVLKVGAVAALAAAGVDDPVVLAVSLVGAPPLAAAVALGVSVRLHPRSASVRLPSGGDVGVDLRSFAALTTGSLLLQLFVNVGVVLTQVSVDGEATAFTASLVAGLAIARIPLFLFNAVQSFLLTGFTVDVHSRRFRGLLVAVAAWNGAVLALGVVWVVLVRFFGPMALSFFGPDYELDTAQLVLLAASCVFQIATMVTVQGLLALHRDRTSVLAWPLGLAVLFVVFVLPWGDLGFAVGFAMLAGTVATFVTATVSLLVSVRHETRSAGSVDGTLGGVDERSPRRA